MLKIKTLIFLLELVAPIFMSGQGEANNWYFGFGAGLSFEIDGNVVATGDGALSSYEGVATISDKLGNLLFYTDGATIYNRNHLIMDNGTGLYGDSSSTQSAIIVPQPESPNLYFIFTVDAIGFENPDFGLNYTVVDISLNDGLGAVINKNINLLDDCAEKISAVFKDCSLNSLWVMTLASENGSERPFDTYHAFEVNNQGVNTNSVKSTFNGLNINWELGYLKFSPDGTMLASANQASGLYLYNFDPKTGNVSNQTQLQLSAGPNVESYGVEFSPNSRFLYIVAKDFSGDSSALLQYDLSSNDISGSQVILDQRNVFRGALQLGPNGKIYRALSEDYETGLPYLGVINYPDEKGIAANYEHNAVPLVNGLSSQGLPPFVQSFFDEFRLNREEDVVIDGALRTCINSELILEVQSIPGASYIWRKDGVVFSNPDYHSYEVAAATASDEGVYTVTIIRPGVEECPIEGEIEVFVDEVPEGNSMIWYFCDTDADNAADGITSMNLEDFENKDNGFVYTYYESISDQVDDISITNPTVYRNSMSFEQTIFYKITNISGCENTGDIKLTILEAPIYDLNQVYFMCGNDSQFSISGPEGFDAYKWFRVDGGEWKVFSNEKDLNILSAGNYMLEASVVVTNNGVVTSCPIMKEFEVQSSNAAVIDEINVDRFTDNDTNVEITVIGEGDYEFSADGTTYQNSNILENINEGEATFYVRDKNGCGVVTETITLASDTSSIFPIFFTPNNDGVNDLWQVIPAPNGEVLDIATVYIYNRFGNLLVQMNPKSNGWDGSFMGQPLPSSDYWFKAVTFGSEEIRGHFTLKR